MAQRYKKKESVFSRKDKNSEKQVSSKPTTPRYASEISVEPVVKKTDTTKKDKEEGKSKKIILNILLILFIGIFLFSGYMIVDDMFIRPMNNNGILNDFEMELLDQVGGEFPEFDNTQPQIETEESEEPEEVEHVSMSQALQNLAQKYPHLVAWIDIKGTDMKFPVVKPDLNDSEYYLYRNYAGERSEYGTIFYDKSSNLDSENQILHGHSMFDGSMFYPLISFGELDVYEKSPVIYLDTIEESSAYKIVAVVKTNILESQGEVFNYFKSDFYDNDDKMQYIYEMMNRSIIDTGVYINSEDEFLTLSTCSYEYEQFRTVIVARKVREGESTEVDTSQAIIRNNTLYPDIWYSTHGGSKPNLPVTFEEAKSVNVTDWWYKEE